MHDGAVVDQSGASVPASDSANGGGGPGSATDGSASAGFSRRPRTARHRCEAPITERREREHPGPQIRNLKDFGQGLRMFIFYIPTLK